MDNNERKLSQYIDKLNAEQKPEQHGEAEECPELERLYDTVRMVRGLKEPDLPQAGYPKKLAGRIKKELDPGRPASKRKRLWLGSMAGIAAVLVAAVLLSSILPFGTSDMVYAMEEAFQDVKAYHGVLEIVETNARGEQTLQAKLEVWADKEGRYYIKGLEGWQKDLLTVNNGRSKWQVRPEQKEVHVFPAFPDSYRFILELGNEIEQAKNALSAKVVGEDTIAGRKTDVLEVTPRGGMPYRIWVDKETRLPLQKQTAMQNALQSTVTYTAINFGDIIPGELLVLEAPDGYSEVDKNPEQFVNSVEEAADAVGFTPGLPRGIPSDFSRDGISIVPGSALTKLYYTANDNDARVILIQGKAQGDLKPARTAVLGKVDDNTAEVQSPVYEEMGILGGGGLYAGVTDISSIRWQQDGFEYAVVGSAGLEDLAAFAEGLSGGSFEMPVDGGQSGQPAIEVPVDMDVERSQQKGVDAGSSPWRLDPVYVAQVFVSLEMSPGGITGEYPIEYQELEVIENTGKDAVVEISGDETPIRKVYLKRLIRQDSTGIWTVVGYDPTSGQ